MMAAIDRKFLPFLATVGVLIALFGTASFLYPGFFSARVVVNLLADNAFLGIAAIGMTFVILSGGIDLSIGSVVAFTGVLTAVLIGKMGMHPLLAIPLALTAGAGFGALQGFLIQRYELPPFLATLAGMFLVRGLSFGVSKESLGIVHPFYSRVLDFGLPLGAKLVVPATALIFLAIFGVALFVAHRTVFGRNIYALGGSESSALMMGLPVASTRIAVYALSGLCSAMAGVTATFYMGSGNPAMGAGLELDAIAAVVIGGTLLSGGVGYLAGTLAGVLIFGTIQSALIFDGRLNSWWLRIAVGLLLLIFILLQRLIVHRAASRKAA